MSQLLTHAEAAALLKMAEREIVDVMVAPDGAPVITTYDGVQYIVVDPEHPDAAGKSGLMYLNAPVLPEGRVYVGDFPIYENYADPANDPTEIATDPVPVDAPAPDAPPADETAGKRGR